MTVIVRDNAGCRNNGESKPKRRSEKGRSQAEDVYKLIRAGCNFCDEPHKFDDCPHRAESAAAAMESYPKYGGYMCSVRRNLSSGMGPALTVNVTTQRQYEFWVVDSDATECITQDPGGMEDYELAPAEQRVKDGSGFHMTTARYGRLRLLVDQGVRDVLRPARELALKRVAHVPNLGQHNLISVKPFAQSNDAPIQFYLAGAIIRPRSGGRLLIFHPLRLGNRLLEFKFAAASPV